MKHIFFVEDDLSLINGLSFAIKKQGYELTIARTSVEAEQLWTNGNYDLVILDVTLPDGSGFDLCRKIRASSKVPIMFLTAADEETDIIMGLDIGGDDYMTKPFKLAVFLSRSESFGVSAVEAMSCSVPVIASDAAGFMEVLEDGAGVIVPCGDVESAAEAMARLATDAGERMSLAVKGRRRVEERYDWEKNVETMIKEYGNVLLHKD